MSEQTIFLLLAFALVLLLALIAVWPWLRTPRASNTPKHLLKPKADSLLNTNVALFKERLQELEADFTTGQLDKTLYAEQKLELERQLLAASEDASRAFDAPQRFAKGAWVLIAALPLLVFATYLVVEPRGQVFELWQARAAMNNTANELLTGQINQPPPDFFQGNIQKNTQHLLQTMQMQVYAHAHEPRYWLNMSQTYMALEDVPAAVETLSRARRLAPDDAGIAMTYAQVMFFSQGGQLDSDTRHTVAQVLAKEPNHEGAQMLMAMGEVQAQNYTQAHYWVDRLKASLTSKSGDHSEALASLDELSRSIDEKAAQAKQAQNNALRVTVVAEAALVAKLQSFGDKATLFVLVKPKQGGAPVAVQRFKLSEVLTELTSQGLGVTLSDQDSMMPTHTLSTAKHDKIPLILTAKISQTGAANTSADDVTAQEMALPPEQLVSLLGGSQQLQLLFTQPAN